MKRISAPLQKMMSRYSTSNLLFGHQERLGKLPIPSLGETASRFLLSVKPLAASNEQYEETKRKLESFLANEAPVLQKRLIEKDIHAGDKSWLIEWWNEYAYMGYRDPVVIYVNYFFGTHFFFSHHTHSIC
jgi:carnitine O-acetyltransferase